MYSSLQEGQDIFGVDFDYDEFEKYGEEDYESEEDEDLDEYLEDDEEEGELKKKELNQLCLWPGVKIPNNT